MTTLYLDPFSGLSGNMIMAALLDLFPERAEGLDDIVERLPIEGVSLKKSRVQKKGIEGLHIDVVHPEQHAHRHLSDCLAIIDGLSLKPSVQQRAHLIFETLAEAEAKVHGSTKEEIHFHEVGAVDAIVDVVAAAFLLEGVQRVLCGPLRTGYGFVQCAHGNMPVPAPATAHLLAGLISYQGDAEGEFTTPTGAAIAAACAEAVHAMPTMRIDGQGTGAGTRDAPHPNLLRVFMTRESLGGARDDEENLVENLLELSFHTDDMSAEGLAHFCDVALEEGALDVATWSGAGKKSRLTLMTRVLCSAADGERLRALCFAKTSTLGIREGSVRRHKRARESVALESDFGKVRAKRFKDGSLRFEPDDVAKIAREKGISYDEVMRRLFAGVFAQRAEQESQRDDRDPRLYRSLWVC